MKLLSLSAIPLLAAGLNLDAAEANEASKPKAEAYLTVETAGRDYQDQGEYTNDWGGAQVIALGQDKFRLVTYKGGLPGAGWDKETKSEAEGKREADAIVFKGKDDFKAELAQNKISIYTGGGGPYAMNKIFRSSSRLGAKPPAGAIVLFEGNGVGEWDHGRTDDRGWLRGGCTSKKKFQNFTLHAEF